MDRYLKALLLIYSVMVLSSCASEQGRVEDQGLTAQSPPQASGPEINEVPEPMAKPEPPKVQDEPPPMKASAVNEKALDEAIKSNNIDRVYSAAVMVLSDNPKTIKALNAMGIYHLQKGQTKAAKLFFDKSLKVNPNQSEIYNNLGIVALTENERSVAIRQFRKALEISGENAVAANNLGILYVDSKDYPKALAVFDIAQPKFKSDHRYWNNVGIALTGSRNYDKAKKAYEDGLRLKSNDIDLMFNYSILLIQNLKAFQSGNDLLNRLKVLGPRPEMRTKINALEIMAKAGLK